MNGAFSLVLKTRAVGYRVEYRDALIEKYVVTYIGNMDVAREQRCDSVNAWCPWIETMSVCPAYALGSESCTWTFRAYVVRRLTMVNRAGEQFHSSGGVFEISPFDGDEGLSWTGRHEQRCAEVKVAADNEFLIAARRMKAEFDRMVIVDSERMLDYFKYCFKNVSKVIQTPD